MTKGFERRQQQRYAVLKHMYDVAVENRNDPTMPLHEDRIAEGLDYPKQDVKSALSYLEGKYLIEVVTVFHGGDKDYKLAHRGIEEIERSFQKPEEPTEHFPSQIIQNFNAPVGAVQTGANNTANVTQNVGADLSNVFNLLEKLKLHATELPPEQQEDALDSIEALEDELNSQDRNPKRVKVFLTGLERIARGTVTFTSQVAILAQQLKNLGVF